MRGTWGALLALLLGGCATFEPATREPPRGIDAGATLVFIDRLHRAGASELAVIGERLDPRGGLGPRVQRILWQGTPGHAGYVPAEATRALAALLDEAPAIDGDARKLLRIQLAHLRERQRLLEARAALRAENRELQRQIEALTDLERRIGTGEDGDGE